MRLVIPKVSLSREELRDLVVYARPGDVVQIGSGAALREIQFLPQMGVSQSSAAVMEWGARGRWNGPVVAAVVAQIEAVELSGAWANEGCVY